MRAGEHFVARFRIFLPVLCRFLVDRADFPLLERVGFTVAQASFLLALADVEVIFDQGEARVEQQLLEQHDVRHEVLVFGVGAEAHDPFDPGAIVPAAVEQRDFARYRQFAAPALEIPGLAVAFVRHAHGDDAGIARTHMFGDSLDRAVLARRIAPFENDQ